ncbi:hypothetical protein GGR56DRAFT_417202 [Xylariaceae sp. FL0804]|nr:hypothetical protein GGR56DRAFT_417202 [Xylariaceae sp. FL0804]
MPLGKHYLMARTGCGSPAACAIFPRGTYPVTLVIFRSLKSESQLAGRPGGVLFLAAAGIYVLYLVMLHNRSFLKVPYLSQRYESRMPQRKQCSHSGLGLAVWLVMLFSYRNGLSIVASNSPR